MKRLIPLTFAFILGQCHAQMALGGSSYRLFPDCGPRGCGVSFYVSNLGHQDLIEVGFEGGAPYFRHSTFFTHGTYD